MNVLQKSSITVAIATGVTSLLILSTGVSVAENSSVSLELKADSASISAVEKIDETAESKTNLVAGNMPPPPTGLFLEGKSSPTVMGMKKNSLLSPIQPKAPMAPSKSLNKSMPPVSVSVAPNQPQFNVTPPTFNMPANSMQAPKMAMSARKQPTLNKPPQLIAGMRPNRPTNAPTQLEMHPAMKRMQQHFNQMRQAPIPPSAMMNNQQQNSVAPQKYMFVPAPYVQGYRYYQMPTYGAYYYAPSQQMMPHYNMNNQPPTLEKGKK